MLQQPVDATCADLSSNQERLPAPSYVTVTRQPKAVKEEGARAPCQHNCKADIEEDLELFLILGHGACQNLIIKKAARKQGMQK